MGYHDDIQEAMWRGFSPGQSQPVCTKCIEDDALADFIEENTTKNACHYCGEESDEVIAVELDSVIEHMVEKIRQTYCDPADTLPYDGGEGGYQGNVIETDDLLSNYVEYSPSNSTLLDDVLSGIAFTHWAEREWAALDTRSKMMSGWDKFKEAIIHDRRFTFWDLGDEDEEDYHPDHYPIGKVLQRTCSSILEFGLLAAIPAGSKYWRVRIPRKDKVLGTEADFASPPKEHCRQENRMSPAGISMFYGAEYFSTACKETVDIGREGWDGACGIQFTSLFDMNLVDLTKVKDRHYQSYFVDGTHERNWELGFLKAFEKDITRPIDRHAGRQDLEYIPTQALTEYIRVHMRTDTDEPIHGIRYRSSRDGQPCVVLFCDHKKCFALGSYGNKQWLQGKMDSLTRISSDDLISTTTSRMGEI